MSSTYDSWLNAQAAPDQSGDGFDWARCPARGHEFHCEDWADGGHCCYCSTANCEKRSRE